MEGLTSFCLTGRGSGRSNLMCCICSGGLWEGEDCWVSKTMMMMMITKGRGSGGRKN